MCSISGLLGAYIWGMVEFLLMDIADLSCCRSVLLIFAVYFILLAATLVSQEVAAEDSTWCQDRDLLY